MIDLREKTLRKLAFTVLEDLAKQGFLKRTGYGVYQLNSSSNFFEGELQMTARGAGFVIPDDSEKADIFVPPHGINQALDGDIVKVQITKRGRTVMRV